MEHFGVQKVRIVFALQSLRAVVFGSVTILTSACSTPQSYVETTSKFAGATANLADASTAYFNQVNYVNFETSVVRAKYNREKISKETIQEPFFPESDMAVRRTLIATLRTYAASLAKISNDNLGEAFRTEVIGLQDDVSNLKRSIDKASNNTASQTKLTGLKEDEGFIGKVVGGIGKMVVDQMQANAIAKVILEADPAMRAAANLLAEDVRLITDKMQAARAIQFATAVDGVNAELSRAPIDERFKLVESVRPFADGVMTSKALGADFNSALQSYSKAQAEMTAYASAKKDPKTLGDLAAAVDVFQERASYLLAIVRSRSKF